MYKIIVEMGNMIFLQTPAWTTWVTRDWFDKNKAALTPKPAARPRFDDAQIEMRRLEEERQARYDREDARR